MDWNDWPVVLWIAATFMSLLRRRWMDATWSACFAAFVVFDRLLPTAIPAPLKYMFLIVGVALVVTEVLKDYARDKKSLVTK
ncbi:hypothetical protein G4G28_05110 [Massilia sp. Dwa41.01b]|uniref:hypothetical protein n=1 Tax=unclassified Massilia TaxID=2609279 RepID=UPI001600D5AD|nr:MULTISPECIES: hypothetical protein [unclassified Massilia]QNA88014.1 hypothetical protein G4G28_05110 [Massilia sp. Dwa41.01b]QNA98916.1 hypothetical protein G4G31_08825 [Massilia sp. Se16.2.3]